MWKKLKKTNVNEKWKNEKKKKKQQKMKKVGLGKAGLAFLKKKHSSVQAGTRWVLVK